MGRVAAIVLAGGRSSRMGSPKADLRWGSTTLVAHIARTLASAVDGPVVVVRAGAQLLPDLPAGVEVAEDAHEGRGPLEGFAAGLHAVSGRADAVYLSATDVPLLDRAFVRSVVAELLAGPADAAVPLVADRMHPLAAAYRTSIEEVVVRLLRAGRNRATDLLDEIDVRWLHERELRAVDPELVSLRNLNTREEYLDALRR